MQYDIIFSEERHLFVIKTQGMMSGHNFIKMSQDILDHPGWIPGTKLIFDHQNLDFSNVSHSNLNKIRIFHQDNEKLIGNGKCAIVVGFGLKDAWHTMWNKGEKIVAGNQVMVFDNFDEAVFWIFQ